MRKSVIVFTCLLVSMIAAGVRADNKIVVVPLGAGTQQQTLYLMLPPAAFLPTIFQLGDPAVFINSGDWLSLRNLLGAGLAAPIQLPQGSNVTDVSCYVYDNSAEDLTNVNTKFVLWRRAISATDIEEIIPEKHMGTEGLQSSTTIHAFTETNVTAPLIDNQAYFYGLRVLLKATALASNDLRFYGCRLSYTANVIVP